TSAVAVSISAMPCLFAGAFINVLIVRDGLHWLAAYGVIVSLGAMATALGVLITIFLFRMAGAKRTRLVSQILAAVIGAAFIIGIQAIAVIYYGSLSRVSVFQSPNFINWFPDVDNAFWIVARATMGELTSLLPVMAVCLGCFAGVVLLTSESFGDLAVAAASVSNTSKSHRHLGKFKGLSARKTLRSKEWKLLARDPWLVSQSVMQILYLLPPALLLWSHYRESANILMVVAPVLVMASGQLAGGLAWLAISGEDAPDLIDTAPLGKKAVLFAKIESIISLILLIVAPLLAGIALISVTASLVIAAGVLLASSSATAIQLWFKSQSNRAMFRRRQVASRTATISEAIISILWAASTTLLLVNTPLGVITSCLTVVVLFFVWVLRLQK
ncbi:MAG: permease, partial [Hyphomicrobiales bacterium]